MARVFAAFFASFSPASAGPPAEARASLVHVVPIEGPIGPATSDLVTRSIDQAAADGADLVVLRLDTPGGLDSSMRVIIRSIIEAPMPVVAYVAPSGARAASAGTFILYASHVAAMAPGTNLGAATPVPVGGGGFPGSGGEEDGEPSASESKAVEDAAAYIRSLAEMRDRDPEFAEAAVREARSLTSGEALEAGVIDLVARDLSQLLERIDGREVELERGPVAIASADPAVETIEPDWRYQLLAIITNPNVAAILMLIGVYGIIFEFYSPGSSARPHRCDLPALGPLRLSGPAGQLCRPGALAPRHGAHHRRGVRAELRHSRHRRCIAAFTAGAILLMDTDVPGFGISPWLIGAFAASTAIVFVTALGMVLRGRERPVVTGRKPWRMAMARW
jgi:membrane-bound serine protease (ClpP class)